MVSYQQEKGDNNMKDPVCGMEVDEKSEALTHDGKDYRFCCASCRWAFEKNPNQFVENKT